MSKARSARAWATLLALVSVAGCSAAADPDDTEGPGEEDPGPAPLAGAPGISLSDIALYQGIKRPLVEAGQPSGTTLPIVAGRDALLRVFVQNDGSFAGSLTGRLHLGTGEPIEVTSTLGGNSDDGNLASTLNFEVPGAALTPDQGYRLELGALEGGSKDVAPIAYPAEGTQPIPATPVGDTLKIMIVPIQYQADGSGRLPNTSDEQMALYQQGFGAMYPVPRVEISLHEPMAWGSQVGAFGDGWDTLLMAVAQLRASDGAPPDLYYFGAFAPASSLGAYCGGGCVAGLGMSSGPEDSYARAAIGLDFGGPDDVTTALHEVGHNHGRQHSPCETYDADPAYPYHDGSDGVWGYDRATQQLFPPTAADIMGYCTPSWISDWTFVAFFDRIRAVNGAGNAYVIGDPAPPKTYDRARVDADGTLHLADPVTLHRPPSAEPRALRLRSSGTKSKTVTAQYYAFDHLPGGVLLWEHAPDARAASLVGSLAHEARLR